MNTIIKVGCLIGLTCALATPVFAGEQKIILMLGGKFLRPISAMQVGWGICFPLDTVPL